MPLCVTLEFPYMPERCNCGTQLVEGSLFCHKCGRPLRDIPEPESSGAVPVMKIEPVYPAVNFRNPVAFKIALLMAVGATVVFFLPLLNWMAAGFFTALLYRRRTGYLITLQSGLRLGWITGVLMFAIALVMITISFAMTRTIGMDALVASLPPAMKGTFGTQIRESVKFFQSAPDVIQLLITDFIAITLFSMVGAALGAKITRRDHHDPAA
jgi:hypothetical protein